MSNPVSLPPATRQGRISYSVYLYQQLLVDAPQKLLSHQPRVVQLAATI